MSDKLVNEIRLKLASIGKNKILKVNALPADSPGYVFRDAYWYGVAIPYSGKLINENFSNAQLCCISLTVHGISHNMLAIQCNIEEVRHQFASVCAEFLDPGINGIDRERILEDPANWWNAWRELLGNAIHEKRPYQILGELLVLEKLLKIGENAIWQGPTGKTQDIETDNFNCEVKSTLDRYANLITVSSKFQLDPHGKQLKLAFVRFEPSATGDSLKDAIDRLVSLGCDYKQLIRLLAQQGVVPGNMAFTKHYRVLETRLYDVNNEFPIITDSSFVEGHMPQNVTRFTYCIDLTGITYSVF